MFFKNQKGIKKIKKSIAVYISEKYQQIIIAPRHENNAGIVYEQENCMSLDRTVSSIELGVKLINNLDLYSLKDANLRDSKLADWPAFKYSKLKSLRIFEQEYIYISVVSCNEHNLILEISGFPYKNSELTVNSIISYSADKEEIGNRILKVYEACLTGKI